ncbi:MAG: biotin-dependent carboxyltransferase family protein [Verrucomicrobiales bacterium]|nr:biotin-dependent carboxyltransferase family protein [Verrucomicrobiales bacterium]
MGEEAFQVLDAGLGASLQDEGRIGWRRFGVPVSGAMDSHAMHWANQLLGNPVEVPVLELLLQGARLRALRALWLAVTGADAQANVPTWRTVRVSKNDVVEFPRNRSGVWAYLAVEGGFGGQGTLGSASTYVRGALGGPITRGQELHTLPGAELQFPHQIAGRIADWSERRNYDQPPPLRVWRGPQWSLFDDAVREQFFSQRWVISSRSDRVGYRLEGVPLRAPAREIISEPVLVGSIQVPPNGQPIVTMRDGPPVGGYPKIGLVDPDDVSRLAQCRPGTKVSFLSREDS